MAAADPDPDPDADPGTDAEQLVQDIGHQVAHYRRARGLTQEELAGLLGVSLSLLQKWEQGVRPIRRFADIVRIARVLGVRDISALLGQPLGVTPDASASHPAVAAIRSALAVPRTTTPVDVARLEADTATAEAVFQAPGRWRYAHTGSLLPELLRSAGSLTRLDDSARAHRAAARVYRFAQPFAKRAGELDIGIATAAAARAHAARAGDLGSWAAAEWSYAQAMSVLGHPEDSRAVAEAAIAEAGDLAAATPGDLAAVGGLHFVAAINAVRLDEHDAARQLLAGADRIAARLGQDTNYWGLAFGPTNAAIHRVSFLTERGQARLVLDGARTVDSSASPIIERHLTHTLEVSLAAARVGEWARAHDHLELVDSLSPEEVDWSVTAREVVRSLLHRAPREHWPRAIAHRLGLT